MDDDRSPRTFLLSYFTRSIRFPLSEIESKGEWKGEIRHTKRDGSRIIVVSRWTKIRDGNGDPAGWLEINTDITFRKSAEDAARALSGRILTLQDEERRRMAKGLHDSLGQYLAALKMNLDSFPVSGSGCIGLPSVRHEIKSWSQSPINWLASHGQYNPAAKTISTNRCR